MPRDVNKEPRMRWKLAAGAVVLTLAVGPVAGCSKSSGAKQTATEAKGKSDPKAAKSAKTTDKSAKPADKTAKTPANAQKGPAPNPAAQGAKPATTPAKSAPAAATASKTPPPATKPAQTAAATKPAPASKAPVTPAPAASATPKPAPAAATAKPATAPATSPAPAAAAPGDMQQELQSNKPLIAAIQPRFPAGTDVVKASMGFRNVQQFVAAVHASHNLGIPFDKLRSALVDEKKSLSQAIRALKPTASATIEAQRADYDARGTIFQAKQATAAAAAESAAKKPAKAAAKPKASSN